MTSYECGSLTVAVAALLISIFIPLSQFVYAKTRRTSLRIIPFDRCPLLLQFGDSGSALTFKFSLACKGKPCIVRSIRACVKSGSLPQTTFLWESLMPIGLNWANAGAQLIQMNTATLAHPLLLNDTSLQPLNIVFLRDDPEWNVLMCRRRELLLGLNRVSDISLASDGSADELRLRDLREQMQEKSLWIAGDYTLKLKILFDADGEYEKEFKFALNEEDSNLLSRNAVLMTSAANQTNYYSAMLNVS